VRRGVDVACHVFGEREAKSLGDRKGGWRAGGAAGENEFKGLSNRTHFNYQKPWLWNCHLDLDGSDPQVDNAKLVIEYGELER
jgi:hypothetical protein